MSDVTREQPLSERAQRLLKVLVERYIRDGQPVGSRTLSRAGWSKLSPATIRNVMADLEEMGFVQSPHTSAGRVPTVKGYRFFIDSLLTIQPLTEEQVLHLKCQLDPSSNLATLLESVSELLSGVTKLAGVVTLPRRGNAALRQVEFLPLSDRRVLAILVINEREVQNTIISVARQYSADELRQATNYLNAEFSGQDLSTVRCNLIRELRKTGEDMNRMVRAAIEMAEKVLESHPDAEDYVLVGETNLMGIAELSNIDKLRQLFDAFNRKRDILHLLDQCIHGQGVQIFIGDESGYAVLDECSVVTSPYVVDGRVAGVLGVIGPTRMAYERIIPIVDMTAKLLGAALNPRH
jgi:heat shock gene repressor HrcA